MASHCQNCGEPVLSDSEKFCASCGSKIDSSVAVAEPQAQKSTLNPARESAALQPKHPSLPPQPTNASPPNPSETASAPAAPASDPLQPAWQGQTISNQSVANTNVNVNAQPNIMFTQSKSGPNMLVRAIWFIFIGWWLGGIAIGLAWLLMLPIITIPASIWIINRLPGIMTLRPRTASYQVRNELGLTIVDESTLPQRPWWQRILYVVFVGWWFGFLWLSVAWLVGVLGIVTFGLTLPVAFWMFNRAGAVTSLYRT